MKISLIFTINSNFRRSIPNHEFLDGDRGQAQRNLRKTVARENIEERLQKFASVGDSTQQISNPMKLLVSLHGPFL